MDKTPKRTAYGIRTRVTAVRGRRPEPLDERGKTINPYINTRSTTSKDL